MNLKRKVMVVSGTRADYGLLKTIITEIAGHKDLELKLVVTGSHLSSEHGNTVTEIEADGFPIAYKLPILKSKLDSRSVVDSLGDLLKSFNEVLTCDRPDIVLLIGDRYEAFGAATACLLHNLPIAHVHGGELTFGAVDDAFRHSMTKMSWWHFTTAEEYRQRVIRLGEAPERVYNFGAPVLDALENLDVPKEELEVFLGIKLISPVVLATFHPETLNPGKVQEQMDVLWEGLKASKPGTVVFTKANADAEGHLVNEFLEKKIKELPNSVLVSSLGQRRYLGLMKLADVGFGNSSSLVIEFPIVGTPAVNVGRRQEGRVRAKSVLDVDFSAEAIASAIKTSISIEFKQKIKAESHPFGQPGVARRIVDTLATIDIPKILVKGFYE